MERRRPRPHGLTYSLVNSSNESCPIVIQLFSFFGAIAFLPWMDARANPCSSFVHDAERRVGLPGAT